LPSCLLFEAVPCQFRKTDYLHKHFASPNGPKKIIAGEKLIKFSFQNSFPLITSDRKSCRCTHTFRVKFHKSDESLSSLYLLCVCSCTHYFALLKFSYEIFWFLSADTFKWTKYCPTIDMKLASFLCVSKNFFNDDLMDEKWFVCCCLCFWIFFLIFSDFLKAGLHISWSFLIFSLLSRLLEKN
jgi:hypothetical protein